jgi:hypothetical protein
LGQISLEQEIRKACFDNNWVVKDNSFGPDKLDFSFPSLGLHIDAKERRQMPRPENWPGCAVTAQEFFIFDELTIRKGILTGGNAGYIVRDNVLGGYYWFPLMELLLIPHQRYDRQMEQAFKGKWLISLKHGYFDRSVEDSLFRAFASAGTFMKTMKQTECVPTSADDVVGGGEKRTQRHRSLDYAATR